MYVDKRVRKSFKKESTIALKTVWKVEEKEGGGDARDCEKTAEAANREHQTN